MTRRLTSLSACLAFALFSFPAALLGPQDKTADPVTTRVEPASALERMSWLAGDWSGDAWGGRFHAFYTTPEGGRLLSYSRLEQDGHDTYYEFEVFERRAEGVHLQPFPGGQRADGFELASYDEQGQEAVFENPAKDWPTRISYQRAAADRLVITLSDPHGTSDKVERFDLQRSQG